MFRFFVYTLCLIAFASCVVEEADLSRYTEGTKTDNLEEAKDIEVVYTDSSYVVFILKAPLSTRRLERYSMEEEFPKGIEVTFYDKAGTARSWLKADYAIRNQLDRTITVQKNVVLRNDLGEQIEAPELIWDEKSKEIHTDRFVKITRDDGVMYSHGFKSNEGFTRYELKALSGDMSADEFKDEN